MVRLHLNIETILIKLGAQRAPKKRMLPLYLMRGMRRLALTKSQEICSMILSNKFSQHRKSRAAYFLCFVFLLAGCAAPYQPRGHQSGYTDKRIDDNTYIVNYLGDGTTDAERTWNFWMYRCAELTLEKGYVYFAILPRTRLTSETATPMLRPALAYTGRTDGAGEFVQTKGGGVTYYSYSVPYTYTAAFSNATIKLYRDPLPLSVLIAVDAAKLKAVLAPVVAGKPRELSRRDLLASVAVFNDKSQLANLESATGTPTIVNTVDELRVIANRDLVPAMLNGNVAANTAPIAKKFASAKRHIAEMMTVIQQEFNADGTKKREPATVVQQFVHHPEGYATIISYTTAGGHIAPASFSVNLSIGGIISVRSAYISSLSARSGESGNTLRYGGQYFVNALSGELARPASAISFTTRSFIGLDGVEQRFSADSAVTATSCNVGDTKPASSLHPNLQGNAILITCKATFNSRPISDSRLWFLEDYQWYVRESEQWATGSSTSVIKDVRFAAR